MSEIVNNESVDVQQIDETVDAEQQPASAPPEPDIAALIAEAEKRGYLRARQELAQQRFDAPAAGPEPEPPAVQKPRTDFLSRERRSVWDL